MKGSPAGPLHRVVGIETEYGVTSTSLGPGAAGVPLSVEEAVQEVFRPVESPRSGTHRFTTAGARLYVDVGSHPEYAGPECLWVSDVVAQDLAGDALLADLTQAANERLAPAGVRVHVLKSNTDAWGSTFGCHENYQVARGTRLPLPGLVGFLAARQVLTGAGALPALGTALPARGEEVPAPGLPLWPLRYSARAEHISAVSSADPTHERAFVNTRDEPHADPARWRRLHVVAGDSAMSPWGTAVKVVLLDAVLTLVEQEGWDLAECELLDPVQAARTWNQAPATLCPRRGGRPPLACPDLLELVLERLADAPGLGADALTKEVLELARRGAQAVRTGEAAPVSTELDWAVKHRVLSRVAQRAPQGWADPQVRRADLAYHDLSRSTGLREALSAAGLMRPLVPADVVAAARTQPPGGTRAGLRGRVVEACERTGRSLSVGWAHVRLDEPPQPQIDLPDPRCSQDEAVEALLARIEALGEAPRRAPGR